MTGAKIGETRPDNDASTLHNLAAVVRVRRSVGVISGKKRAQYYPALSESGIHQSYRDRHRRIAGEDGLFLERTHSGVA